MLGGLRGTPLTGLRGGISGDRVHKLARLLDARDRDALYHAMISVTSRPETLVRGGAEPSALFGAWRSEEHTSELQSLMRISYAVFCLKNKIHQHYHPKKITNHTDAKP